MDRTPNVTIRAAIGAPMPAVLVAVIFAAGCSVFGGGPNSDAGTPASSPAEQRSDASAEAETTSEVDPSALSPGASIEERLLAADYEGVLAIYAADSTLHYHEDATYRAALAAAMSGHPAHDPALAARLLNRLLERHPDTERRFEIEVYLDVLGREREHNAKIRRLDHELQQLKAIDLGQAPPNDAREP